MTVKHRNIFRRYPVRLLPDDLREGFESRALVTVTIEFDVGDSDEFVESEFEHRNGIIIKLATRFVSEKEFRLND